MMRNLILFIVVTATLAAVQLRPDGPGGTAWGQSLSSQPVVQDNFDDNKRGSLWKVYIEDSNCWVAEVNKHLEFGVKKKLSDAFAGYLGDGWWIDPTSDFTMKLDLSYDLMTMDSGWIGFGVTPNPQAPHDQFVAVGIGCSTRYPTYWHEYRDGYDVLWDFTTRFLNRVTLYISYDALRDELYVSDSGYGSSEFWRTFPGLIRGQWNSAPLFVLLGETADGAIIESGHAFVDNFVVESGKCAKPEPPEPNTPPDPNDGTPGNETEPNVPAAVVTLPSELDRREVADSLMVMAVLPKGIRPSDVNSTPAPLLWPGGAKATEQSAFIWLSGKTIVLASFGRAKLMEAVPDNGQVELQFIGRLKDGRTFGGACMVTLK